MKRDKNIATRSMNHVRGISTATPAGLISKIPIPKALPEELSAQKESKTVALGDEHLD